MLMRVADRLRAAILVMEKVAEAVSDMVAEAVKEMMFAVQEYWALTLRV